MIIPLVLVIILGIAYILPRQANKNDKIANSRIEDRFSSKIRVLDTSARRVSSVAQCSTRRIHPANNNVKNLKPNMKNGLTMNKISALRIKHTKDIRALASLKADHAARNSQREVALRIRVGFFITSVLTAFAMLGMYFASVVSFSWILLPISFACVMGVYMNIKSNKDRREVLIEKKKINNLQKKITQYSQSKVRTPIVSNKSVNSIRDNHDKNDLSNVLSENIDIQDVPTLNNVEVNANNNANLNMNSMQNNIENASKWTATRIPTPLYARINAQESMKELLVENSSLVEENVSNEYSDNQIQETNVYRPTVAKPIQDGVDTDQLVEKEVRFNLEDVLRSRITG